MTALDGPVMHAPCGACGGAHAPGPCSPADDLAAQVAGLAARGMAAAAEGRLHSARAMLGRAGLLGLEPAAWRALGLVALALGDERDATAAWRSAADAEPNGPATEWLASLRDGEIRQALDAYGRGARAAADGSLDEAHTALDAALAALPQLVPAARLQGTVLVALGRPAEARRLWRAQTAFCSDDTELLRLIVETDEEPRTAEISPTVATEVRQPEASAAPEPELRLADASDSFDAEALEARRHEWESIEERLRKGWARLREAKAAAGTTAARPSDFSIDELADATSDDISAGRPALRPEEVRARRWLIGTGIAGAVALLLALDVGNQRGNASATPGRDGPARARVAPDPIATDAAQLLGVALDGDPDSLARAIWVVGSAQRTWTPAAQKRAAQVQDGAGRDHLRIGLAWLHIGRRDAAIPELEWAAEFGTHSAYHDSALYYLGTTQLATGDSAHGRDALRRLVALHPTSPFANDLQTRRAAAPTR